MANADAGAADADAAAAAATVMSTFPHFEDQLDNPIIHQGRAERCFFPSRVLMLEALQTHAMSGFDGTRYLGSYSAGGRCELHFEQR